MAFRELKTRGRKCLEGYWNIYKTNHLHLTFVYVKPAAPTKDRTNFSYKKYFGIKMVNSIIASKEPIGSPSRMPCSCC